MKAAASRAVLWLAAITATLIAGVALAPAASAATACTVAYTGDTLVDPGAGTTLAADISNGLLAGANRAVTFTLNDGTGGVWQYRAVTDLRGHASSTVSAPEGVYSVVASVAANTVDSGCSTPAEPNDTLLSVTTIGARFGATGTINSTSGMVRFGLHLRTLADGSSSGHIRLRIYPPSPVFPPSPIRVFRATTITYPPSPCRADVTGSGVLDGQPGYTYALTALDQGKKASDAFALTLTAPDASTIFTTNGLQALTKGRITYWPPSPIRASDPCQNPGT
jgi:hypothetical protein